MLRAPLKPGKILKFGTLERLRSALTERGAGDLDLGEYVVCTSQSKECAVRSGDLAQQLETSTDPRSSTRTRHGLKVDSDLGAGDVEGNSGRRTGKAVSDTAPMA